MKKKFYNLGAWFVSDVLGNPEDKGANQVGNPEDRVSRGRDSLNRKFRSLSCYGKTPIIIQQSKWLLKWQFSDERFLLFFLVKDCGYTLLFIIIA